MLRAASTSAESPIGDGRFRPMPGEWPTGTSRGIATRPLRSPRHRNFCGSDMGLGAWRWPFQLPLEEAHAPQTRGVHGLRRHVEAPTGADAVIETLPHAPEREGGFRSPRRPLWGPPHDGGVHARLVSEVRGPPQAGAGRANAMRPAPYHCHKSSCDVVSEAVVWRCPWTCL